MLYCYSKKCFIAIIIAMFMQVGNGYAQQDATAVKATNAPGTVTGMVIDQDGQPLPGAQVNIKDNTTGGVVSSAQGQFSINAATGSTLVFTAKNHVVLEVKATAGDMVVRLLDNYLQTRDTIDVLYGTKDIESNLGSISTIYTNQLKTTPASTYAYALPGQLAGLYTNQVRGFAIAPKAALFGSLFGLNFTETSSRNANISDNSEISLSLRGRAPITIVDGVQRDITSLDPESIESISVLKDAASSMFLGINSSRGVLLVTSKKPIIGKPRISFTAQYGIQQSLGIPEPLPSYQAAYLYNEALLNSGKLPLYTADDIQKYRDHSDPIGHPDVNWFNTLLKKSAPMSSYKLNVNGGSAIARYSVSLNYFNQDGMFKSSPDELYESNNSLSRYIINSAVDVKVTRNMNVQLQIFGRTQTMNEPAAGLEGADNVLINLYNMPSYIYPTYNPNGSFAGTSSFKNNLLAQAQHSGYLQTITNDVFANLNLNYDLGRAVKGLSLNVRGNLAFQSQDLIDRSIQNQTYLYNATEDKYSTVGSPYAQRNAFRTVLTSRLSFYQAGLNYNRSFGKNNLSGSLLYDARNVVSNYDLSATTTNRAAKAGYNYDNKYFAELSVNNSGYNRFNPDHQFGWFWAASAGWQMGKESFIKDNISWISSWKWRAVYGKTGENTVDRYAYYGYRQAFGRINGLDGYRVGIGHENIYVNQELSLANPKMEWEKAKKLDIGTDISLFNSHLDITADYYLDNYYDQLAIRGNSIELIGIPYPAENIAKTRYTGAELTVTYKGNSGNFNYFISGNGSLQASKTVYFDELQSGFDWNYRTGQPVNAIFGYQALGFYKDAADVAANGVRLGEPNLNTLPLQAGDVKYADLNKDGVINAFDQTVIGNKSPLIFYGLSLGFNYQGFSFSTIIQGVANRDISTVNNQNYGFYGSNFGFGIAAGNYSQPYANILNRWTPETAATATSPRLTLDNYNNDRVSSLYIKSGDYVRLKNVEIGYTFPVSVSKKLSLSSLRLFVNGENLATLGGYRGSDPEVYVGNAANFPYFIQRVFNGGISIKL
jgi:TonB-linked SusC/RagA family outer membrane protein